jgi:hypothetical protein
VCLGVAGWAALAPLPAASRERVYVIPRGTAAAQAAGKDPQVLPANIRLTLGRQDILVLRNEDDAPQTIGVVRLEPGQTFRLPFYTPMEMALACSAHGSGRLVISAEPDPTPGWGRLRWRVRGLVEK